MAMLRLFAALARQGRLLLVAGLVAGVGLPGLAEAMVPWLPVMIASLLFLTGLRIAPERLLTGPGRLTLGTLAAYQLAMPLIATAGLAAMGMLDTAAGLALVLVLAAAPLAGSPNLSALLGYDPAPAMKLVVFGTAALPLTALPALWLLPGISDLGTVFAAVGRLLAVILGAAGAAALLRRTFLPDPAPHTIAALDGAAAVVMAVVVVGLMAPMGPLLVSAPGAILGWLSFAFAINLGLQTLAAWALARREIEAVPLAIVAGNRNIALFLVALPADVAERLLVFIGCYQVPMYLTPILMAPIYRRVVPPQSQP